MHSVANLVELKQNWDIKTKPHIYSSEHIRNEIHTVTKQIIMQYSIHCFSSQFLFIWCIFYLERNDNIQLNL